MFNSVVMLLMPAITAFSYGSGRSIFDLPELELSNKQIHQLIKSLDSPSVSTRIIAANKIGNKNIRETIAHLIAKLKDENPQVRAEVVEALGKFKIKNIAPRIYSILLHDPSPLVRAKAAVVLADIGYKEARNAILTLLNKPDVRERIAAIEALGKLGGSKVFPILIPFLNSDDPEILEVAITALGNLGDKRGAKYVLRFLNRKRATIKSAAIFVLAKLAPNKLKPKLKKILSEGSTSVKISALQASVHLGCSDCHDIINFLIEKSNDRVSSEAAIVASVLNLSKTQSNIIIRLHSNPTLEAKIKYLWALGQFGSTKILGDAINLMNSPIPELRIISLKVIRLLRPANPYIIDKVSNLIYDSEPSVASQAYKLLSEYGKSTYFSVNNLKKIKEDVIKTSIAENIRWLGKIPNAKKINNIIKSWVNSKNIKLKISSVKALGYLKEKKSVPLLLSLIYSQYNELKKNVIKSLVCIASPITKTTFRYIFKNEKNPIIKAYAALGLFKLGMDKQTLGQVAFLYEKNLKYDNPELNLIYSLILYKSGSHAYGKFFPLYFKKYFLKGNNTLYKAKLLDILVFLDQEAEKWFSKAENSKLYRVKSMALLYQAKFRNIPLVLEQKPKIKSVKITKSETKAKVVLPFSSIDEETDSGCSCKTGKSSKNLMMFLLFMSGIIIFKHFLVSQR